jgi:hypothetical protein
MQKKVNYFCGTWPVGMMADLSRQWQKGKVGEMKVEVV